MGEPKTLYASVISVTALCYVCYSAVFRLLQCISAPQASGVFVPALISGSISERRRYLINTTVVVADQPQLFADFNGGGVQGLGFCMADRSAGG